MSKTQIKYPFKQNSLVGTLGLQSEGLHKCKPWIRSMLMWPISTTSNVFPNPSWIFMDAVGCFVLLLLLRFKITWVYLCCISAAPAEWSKFVSVDSATCCVVQRLQLCLGMFIWEIMRRKYCIRTYKEPLGTYRLFVIFGIFGFAPIRTRKSRMVHAKQKGCKRS